MANGGDPVVLLHLEVPHRVQQIHLLPPPPCRLLRPTFAPLPRFTTSRVLECTYADTMTSDHIRTVGASPYTESFRHVNRYGKLVNAALIVGRNSMHWTDQRLDLGVFLQTKEIWSAMGKH